MLFFRTNRTLDRLEEMLDDALNGQFHEKKYDESRLSRLEVKWKRFLSASGRSAEKVKEEQESIKSLISDISHQTKTPLSNILLYTELLKEREKDEELLKMVEKIEEQSHKLTFLMQSLVKTSRLENGIIAMHPKKQRLKPVLQAVEKQVLKAAEEKGIRLQWQCGGEEACFDRKWTEEAICNLVDNAVKYSAPATEVSVGTKVYDSFTAVFVKDEGIGIREEEQAQIFERFYRSGDAEEEKGVGIGLYLARKIATLQGGYLEVRSVFGQGSTFFLYIPNQLRKE